MVEKRKVAVFFGGRSPEHDVSIVTGLQVLEALDPSLFEGFPVYISPEGQWFVGDELRGRENYLLSPHKKTDLMQVTLDMNLSDRGGLWPLKKSFFGSVKPIHFDVAIPAFHGLIGEDGKLQGVFETANIPYTGMRAFASSLFMDKAATKEFLKNSDVGLLPYILIRRPEHKRILSDSDLATYADKIKFPACVKPNNLGSSIGVAKVDSLDELKSTLPLIFQYDNEAIVEPFVENLIEYNVAVTKAFDNKLCTSAIEKPKRSDDLLDFKQKYLSGGSGKTGEKLGNSISEGMLSLTRDFNPPISKELENKIRKWAENAFNSVIGTGAPRIDFLCNEKTQEIWLNEINPCPGSFGYFLWEMSDNPVYFTTFLTSLIEESLKLHRQSQLPSDPTPQEARLFKRA